MIILDGVINIRVFRRYTVEEVKFHHVEIQDHIKNKRYGKFDRFERSQLEYLCNDLNIENQASQDYEDFVRNVVTSAITSERTHLGRNVLIQLADELGVEYEDL